MKKVFLAAICAAALSSCSVALTQAGVGAVYTDVVEGQMVTSNTLGKKVGTSNAIGVLGIVAIGDASIQTAANSAGIKKISHVDCKKTSVLGLFSKSQIFVYGD